jgi:hypothetical protein
MNWFTRVSPLIAILTLAGCRAQVSATFEVVPTQSPSPSVASSPTSSATWVRFDSPWNGYSIEIPSDWTVRSATATWHVGQLLLPNDAAADRMDGPGHLVYAGSQPLPTGSDTTAWMQSVWNNLAGAEGPELPCVAQLADWEEVSVGDTTGRMDAKCPDSYFLVLVTAGERGYTFIDNSTDRTLFEHLLSTVRLTPETAIE